MNVEKPDSPATPDKPAQRGRGFPVPWKRWLRHPAIRITLVIVFVMAFIWLLVRSSSNANHTAANLLDRFRALLH